MNIFQGGFLGLDNIGCFDRSAPLPSGGHLEQSDGTSWMGMYTLNMLAIAMELAREDSTYEDVASKFWEHFLYIADAMNNLGRNGISLWDDADGFYYDVLHLGNGDHFALKARSMVGLIPLFAVETLEPDAERGVHAHAGPRRASSSVDRHAGSAAPCPARDARRARVPVAVRNSRAVTRPPRTAVCDLAGWERPQRGLRAG
jgi:hypothetical protein